MKTPCELVYNYILPNIRALIAREAIEKGMKQRNVAKRLGLTEAAISQYLKGKRAIKLKKLKLRKVEKMIENLVNKMLNEKISDVDIAKHICEICLLLRSSLILCKLHKKVEPKLRNLNCSICK